MKESRAKSTLLVRRCPGRSCAPNGGKGAASIRGTSGWHPTRLPYPSCTDCRCPWDWAGPVPWTPAAGKIRGRDTRPKDRCLEVKKTWPSGQWAEFLGILVSGGSFEQEPGVDGAQWPCGCLQVGTRSSSPSYRASESSPFSFCSCHTLRLLVRYRGTWGKRTLSKPAVCSPGKHPGMRSRRTFKAKKLK